MPKVLAGLVFMYRRIKSIEFHFSGCWIENRGQHLYGCGFAGAVGAEEGKDFSCFDLKEIPLTAVKSPNFLTKVLDSNHGLSRKANNTKRFSLVMQERRREKSRPTFSVET